MPALERLPPEFGERRLLLVKLIGAREAAHVIALAGKQSKLESFWVARMRGAMRLATEAVIAQARDTGRLRFDGVNFVPVLMEHAYATMMAGIESTDRALYKANIAKLAKGAAPRSLRDLRRWWDAYRREGKVPKRQRVLAAGLKKAYIASVEKAWRESSEDFLSGNAFRNTEAVDELQRRAGVAFARAKMIVETETTYHFNASRRAVFDQSPDVSHYLFVAIRDHATTKWCKSRQGLVYAKGDPLLDKETPPIHWNCRSELLPLTRHNPNHLRLIEDPDRQRRAHACEPLPVGWTGRTKAS